MKYRYVFHGGTRERDSDDSTRQTGIAHNSAFMMAAKNVRNDYSKYPDTQIYLQSHEILNSTKKIC